MDQIDEDKFVGGLGDTNEIQVMDRGTGEIVFNQNCDLFGQSVMFVNTCDVSPEWEQVLISQVSDKKPVEKIKIATGPNILPDFGELQHWNPYPGTEFKTFPRITSEDDLKEDYLLLSPEIILQKGKYYFGGEIHARKGGLNLSIVDSVKIQHIIQLTFDHTRSRREDTFELLEETKVKIVLSSYNPYVKTQLDAEIHEVNLCVVDGHEGGHAG